MMNFTTLTIVLVTTAYAINASITLMVKLCTMRLIYVKPGEKSEVSFTEGSKFIIAYDLEPFKLYRIRGKITSGDYWNVSGGYFFHEKLGDYEELMYTDKLFFTISYDIQHPMPVYECHRYIYYKTFTLDSEGTVSASVHTSLYGKSYFEGLPIPKLWVIGVADKFEDGTPDLEVEITVDEIEIEEISYGKLSLNMNTTVIGHDVSFEDIKIVKINADLGDVILIKRPTSLSLEIHAKDIIMEVSTTLDYTESGIKYHYLVNIRCGWYLIIRSSATIVSFEVERLEKEHFSGQLTLSVNGYEYKVYDLSDVPTGSVIRLKVTRGSLDIFALAIEDYDRVISYTYDYNKGVGFETRLPIYFTKGTNNILILILTGRGELSIEYEPAGNAIQILNTSMYTGIAIGIGVGIAALIIIGIIIRRRG